MVNHKHVLVGRGLRAPACWGTPRGRFTHAVRAMRATGRFWGRVGRTCWHCDIAQIWMSLGALQLPYGWVDRRSRKGSVGPGTFARIAHSAGNPAQKDEFVKHTFP